MSYKKAILLLTTVPVILSACPITIQITNPDNNPSLDSSPSPTAVVSSTPIVTVSPTATPLPVSDTYSLIRKEVEVSFYGFKPNGTYGGDFIRDKFYFKGRENDLILPSYSPVGVLSVKEGQVIVEYNYTELKWSYKTGGTWTIPPSKVKDGDLLPIEESATLYNRIGDYFDGNTNARVHFGSSNYYYLVKGDASGSRSDPNNLWYDIATGEGVKVGETKSSKVDETLNVKNNDEFAINIWFEWGNNYIGWWYYYKKDNII